MTSQGTGHLKAIIGSNIRAARAELQLTQLQLAGRVQTDPMNISRWERGAVLPTTENLAAVATATKRDIGWFYIDRRVAA